MKYLCLIYESEKNYQTLPEYSDGRVHAEYATFTESIKKSGHFAGGEALQPVAKATTVRVREGKTLTTDGPFAETKEQLGGYYLIDAKDLDAAIAVAARIPAARFGSIEIRPILVYG